MWRGAGVGWLVGEFLGRSDWHGEVVDRMKKFRCRRFVAFKVHYHAWCKD